MVCPSDGSRTTRSGGGGGGGKGPGPGGGDPGNWKGAPHPSRNTAQHRLGLCRGRGGLFVSLPNKGHDGYYVSGSLQPRHPEPTRLTSHLEWFSAKLFLETRLVFF